MTLRACDLELRVRTPWGQGGEFLEFGLHSPSGAVPYFNETVQGPRIRNPGQYQRHVFEKLERLCEGLDIDGQGQSKAQVAQDLLSLGQDLFDEVLGREMKRFFREMAPRVKTLLVVSDEPWIPWEILHGFEEHDDFFCIQFQMGRWLSGETSLLGEKRVSRMLVVGGEAPGSLPGSDRELAALRTWLSRRDGVDDRILPGATSCATLKELKSAVHDVFHFAGHGLHDQEHGSESTVGFEDRPFRAHHLSASWAPRFRSIRPLVFFNACQTGRLEHSLSGLDGWAARWVQRFGCGAFLAPLWSVKDSAAQAFAQVFYCELAQGSTLGEAVVVARRHLRQTDPASLDWASYSVYGHPNMRVLFGNDSPSTNGGPKERPAPGVAPPPPGVQFRSITEDGTAGDQQHRSRTPVPRGPATSPGSPKPAKSRRLKGLSAAALVGALTIGLWVSDLLNWRSTEPDTAPPPPSVIQDSEDAEAGGLKESETQEEPETSNETSSSKPETSSKEPKAHHKSAPAPRPSIQKPASESTLIQPKQEEFPLRSIISGRLKLVVIQQGSDQRVDDLAALLESLLMQKAPSLSPLGFSATDLPMVRRLVEDPSLLDGNQAPWGAEKLLLVESSRSPLNRPASSPGITLSARIRLLNLRTGSTEFLEAPTKKGVGRSQEGALLQASERCFSNLFLKLGGGSNEDSSSST